MKKIFLIVVLLGVFVTGLNAQAALKTSGGLAYDTLTNAETLYLTYSGTTGTDNLLGIIVYADTLTGTDAVVTAQRVVWLSDATGWAPIGNAVTVIDTTSAGAVAVAEASATFTAVNTFFTKQGVKFTQTGTATTLVKGDLMIRRPN